MTRALQQRSFIDQRIRNTKVFRIIYHRLGAPYRPGSELQSEYKELSVFLLCWSMKLTTEELRVIRSGRDWEDYDQKKPIEQLMIQYHELLYFLEKRGASPAVTYEDVERLFQSLQKQGKNGKGTKPKS